VRDFGCENSSRGRIAIRLSISLSRTVARTEGYTYATKV
jgi:hypothetical protein